MIEPEKKTTQTGGRIAMATLSLEKGKTPRTIEGEEALTTQVAEPGCQIEDPIDLEKEVRNQYHPRQSVCQYRMQG
ncbi:unnamed protein product [Calypogeia fissa]